VAPIGSPGNLRFESVRGGLEIQAQDRASRNQLSHCVTFGLAVSDWHDPSTPSIPVARRSVPLCGGLRQRRHPHWWHWGHVDPGRWQCEQSQQRRPPGVGSRGRAGSIVGRCNQGISRMCVGRALAGSCSSPAYFTGDPVASRGGKVEASLPICHDQYRRHRILQWHRQQHV